MAAKRALPGLSRKVEKIAPKKSFFLFCEGKNTEPEYFEALAARYRGTSIRVVPLRGVGVPHTIAEAAIKEATGRGLIKGSRKSLDSFEENDEVWAVFDRDEHPRYDEASYRCTQKGIGVARSNPCFEVWLILHIEDYHRSDNRHEAQAHLRRLRPEYDPNREKTVDFNALIDAVDVAEARAERQMHAREREGSPYGPPSTSVYLLTQRIKLAAERK